MTPAETFLLAGVAFVIVRAAARWLTCEGEA